MQYIPIDSDGCCGTYECVCNPMKCIETDEPNCGYGYHKEILDKRACCPAWKCVISSPSLDAYSATSSSSLLPADFISSESKSGKDDKSLGVNSGDSTNAEAASASDTAMGNAALTDQSSSSNGKVLTSYAGGDVSISALSDSSALLDGTRVADYGAYAAGRHSALAENYAKALASSESGYMDGTCPGITDASVCPACTQDKVCDGETCVYPRDCPCVKDSVTRKVRCFLYHCFYFNFGWWHIVSDRTLRQFLPTRLTLFPRKRRFTQWLYIEQQPFD